MANQVARVVVQCEEANETQILGNHERTLHLGISFHFQRVIVTL